MKKILLSFILLMSVVSASAQLSVSYGLKGGFNGAMAGFGSKMTMKPSVYLGAHAEIDIDDKFSIQPELIYSRQGYLEPFWVGETKKKFTYRLNYINIPILVKYYLTPALSVDAGPQIGIKLNANLLYDDGYRVEDPVNYNDYYTLFDFSLVAGATYNISDYVALVARYNIGLVNVDKSDEGRLHNNVIQVGIDVTF